VTPAPLIVRATETATVPLAPTLPAVASATASATPTTIPPTEAPTVQTPTMTVARAAPAEDPAPGEPQGTNDLPTYTDVAVLALAESAVLPSGKTFKECVELPPSHEKWPVPVHLYYEGSRRWLVETHVSEVQVEFNEVTATFRTRNFAPPNPGCR